MSTQWGGSTYDVVAHTLLVQHIGNARVTLIRLVPMTVCSLVRPEPHLTNDE